LFLHGTIKANLGGIINDLQVDYIAAIKLKRCEAMMSEKMKAVRLHEFGGPEVLRYEDAPRPTAAAGEVLVRVHAAGINPPDLYLRDGYCALPPEWQPHPVFPLILGTDISGVVASVGDGVTGFSAGDDVYAMVRFPEDLMAGSSAYAQYVCVPASELALKPHGIDHIQAAAAPMSLLTAWQFLIDLGHEAPNPFQPFHHAPVPLKDKTVLVNGAGGGVGHLAVQVAKWQGAHVIAVASGKNEALLHDLGADQFIDYTKAAAESVAENVDLVIDAVGGSNMERFLNVIKSGGALFLVNPLGFAGQDEAAKRGITVSSTQVRSNGMQLAEAGRLLDDGTIRVVIDSTYPLAKASTAHVRASQGSIQGKIVLSVN
jgi:NADPH:quinone reductase-like Zn-dependent oxidoreductase